MQTVSAIITAAQLLLSNNPKEALVISFLLGVLVGVIL